MNTHFRRMALFLLVCVIAFSACSKSSSGGGATAKTEEVNGEEYYNLNMSSENKIARGKDIYDTVIDKYAAILSVESLYFEDDTAAENFQRFKDMVNTKLMINPESLIAPSDDLYNHNTLQVWGGSDFIVQYEDGTSVTIPAAEILAPDGNVNPDRVDIEKKIAKILSKLSAIEDAADVADALAPPPNEVRTVDVEDVNVAVDDTIKAYWDNGEQVAWDIGKTIMKGLFPLLPAGGEGLLAVVDLTDSWLDFEDEDSQKIDIINDKLDNITNLLVGLYSNLEYLQKELEQMQFKIAADNMTDMWIELEKIRTRVLANLNTIKNQVDFDKKAYYATEASLQLNIDIQQYILLSIEYYNRYIDLVQAAKDNYATSKVTIEMPWCCDYTSFSDGRHTYAYKTYAINDIPMDNPEIYLPFQTSKLDFLKVLVFTSLKLNSYLYLDEEDLNEVNSNFIHSYLTQYFIDLRGEMLTAWADWRADAEKAYPVFHDTALNAYTKVDGCNCWDSADWSAPHKNLSRWESTNYPDPRPDNNPKIIINGDKGFTLVKPVTDPAFLVDAQTIVKNYMEARRYRLLEFAASLAALEIQMASYLDDEDFEDYKNN